MAPTSHAMTTFAEGGDRHLVRQSSHHAEDWKRKHSDPARALPIECAQGRRVATRLKTSGCRSKESREADHDDLNERGERQYRPEVGHVGGVAVVTQRDDRQFRRGDGDETCEQEREAEREHLPRRNRDVRQRVPRKEAALAEEPDEQHEVKRDAH